MSELTPISRDEALAAIPDTPATLEFRALALDPSSLKFRSGTGMVLADTRQALVGAIGQVIRDDVIAWYRSHALDCELLADDAAHEALRDAIAFEPARILALVDPWPSRTHSRAGYPIRPLLATDGSGHLPEELHGEIERARGRTTIFTAVLDEQPVSYAYSASMTDTLADISIDTLEAYRNRGIGAATAAMLIDWVVENGRAPVWGAVVDNHASLRLAEKLGFRRAAGRLHVAEAPIVDRS